MIVSQRLQYAENQNYTAKGYILQHLPYTADPKPHYNIYLLQRLQYNYRKTHIAAPSVPLKTTMNLFDQYPFLQNDLIMIHKMQPEDAAALKRIAEDPQISPFVPTFLYEKKYEDKALVIAREEEEYFAAGEGILLGIYLKEAPAEMVGLAEIYGYEPSKEKASIGDRILPEFWGRGISTQAVALLTDYLIGEVGLKTVTAHILRGNEGSATCVLRNGYVQKFSNIYEDWGFGEPCLTDKYVYKRDFRKKRVK